MGFWNLWLLNKINWRFKLWEEMFSSVFLGTNNYKEINKLIGNVDQPL